MALTSINWDEVQIIKDPKTKDITVSFVSVDGGGYGSSDDVDPSDGLPCLTWLGYYGTDGVRKMLPDLSLVYADGGFHVPESFEAKVEVAVYNSDIASVGIAWSDAAGPHTKNLNVTYLPDESYDIASGYIDFSLTEEQRLSIQEGAGVYPVGSIAITTQSANCDSSEWLGSYFQLSGTCEELNESLGLVGDRPVYVSVSSCEGEFKSQGSRDRSVIDAVAFPPECFNQGCGCTHPDWGDGTNAVYLIKDAQVDVSTDDWPGYVSVAGSGGERQTVATSAIVGSESGACGYTLWAPEVPTCASAEYVALKDWNFTPWDFGDSHVSGDLALFSNEADGSPPPVDVNFVMIVKGDSYFSNSTQETITTGSIQYNITYEAATKSTVVRDNAGDVVATVETPEGLAGRFGMTAKFVNFQTVVDEFGIGVYTYADFIVSVRIAGKEFRVISENRLVGTGRTDTNYTYFNSQTQITMCTTIASRPVYIAAVAESADLTTLNSSLKNLAGYSEPTYCGLLP